MGLELPKLPERYVETAGEKKGQITAEARKWQRELAKNIGDEKLKLNSTEKLFYTMSPTQVKAGDTLGQLLLKNVAAFQGLAGREAFYASLANMGRQDTQGAYVDLGSTDVSNQNLFNPHYLEVGEWVAVENGVVKIYNKDPSQKGAEVLRKASMRNWVGGVKIAPPAK